MTTFFKRGIIWRNGVRQKVVYLGKAHTSFIHRGQRFYIEYHEKGMTITHGPSGMTFLNENFKFKENDRQEDIDMKIRKTLDGNWSLLLEKAKEAHGCKWRW